MPLMTTIPLRYVEVSFPATESTLMGGNGVYGYIDPQTATLNIQGSNLKGQAAMPLLSDSYTPQRQALSGVSRASCLLDTVVAKSGGAMWGWGCNKYRQLGSGNQQLDTNIITTPQRLLEKVSDMSAGFFHTVALMDDGKIMGCGSNHAGQLSNRAPEHCQTFIDITPEWAKDDSPFAVFCGGAHTAILTESGSLYTVGLNNHGQLGVQRPFKGEWVPLASSVVAVAVGRANTLWCTEAGSLFSAGDNTYGQSISAERASFMVTREEFGIQAQSVRAGHYHTAVLNMQNELVLFGDNSFGQCDIPEEDRKEVVDMSVGRTHTLVTYESGAVKGFGCLKFYPYHMYAQQTHQSQELLPAYDL